MKARPVALRWSPGLRSSLGPDSPLPPGNSLIRHVTPLTSSAPSAPLLGLVLGILLDSGVQF